MSLSKFAVSKRRGNQMAVTALEEEAPETARTKLLSNSILELRSETEVVEEVVKLWGEAQEKFLAIGRYLRRAKERFPGSFERKIIGALPFGKNVAYQLRLVAEAVDNGRIPEEHLPRSYATAFLLASLPEPDFEEARRRELVRATVTRPEVDAFKRDLKASRVHAADPAQRLREEYRSTLQEMKSLRERYRSLGGRLTELQKELGFFEDIEALPGPDTGKL